jgi:glycosyltransferase involved in cell wall biosynthesis
MSISAALKVEHQVLSPLKEIYDDGPIISVILDCFYGLEYIKQSVQSVIDQEYSNVELMLIDNGASAEISTYLNEIHAKNKNTSLIIYKENQFSWSDREKPISICWNAGLNYCKGDIVTHLAYDDMFSRNYAGKMVRLFKDNPRCIVAGPLPISINSIGDINLDRDFLESNNRPRYIEGKKVALDFVQGSPKKMFSAPGEIFAIRKSLLLKYSGFDPAIDFIQILKYAINGDIGFDPDAHVYWRHHDLQSNRQASAKGHIDVSALKRNINRSDIVNIWKENFSMSEVHLLENYLKHQLISLPLSKAQNMVSDKNFHGLLLVFFHTAKECPEILVKTILHSISFASKIIVNKFKRV